MKLSVSNIAWYTREDLEIYSAAYALGYSGLEIAPTRLYDMPVYDKLAEVKVFKEFLQQQYGLTISSMQSIWFQRTENIFGGSEQYHILLEYTKKAINFAQACGCKNLVFGCPKNRVIDNLSNYNVAISFFSELGEYARMHDTVLAMEANPSIYMTNFVNYTIDAFTIVEQVGNPGFRVNLDLGTILYNNEDICSFVEKVHLINHVHVSEPNLVAIRQRPEHKELADILKRADYSGFVSIEMRRQDRVSDTIKIMEYIKQVFA